jgi:GlpG protein
VLHIAFNTAIFWFFGRQVETLLGRSVLFWLVIFIGIFSNLGQFFAQGAQFGGLSGVVMGLISFVWLATKLNPDIRFFMPNGLMGFVILSLVLGFTGILDQILGPIAHVAHALGFIAGLLLWPLVSLFHRAGEGN